MSNREPKTNHNQSVPPKGSGHDRQPFWSKIRSNFKRFSSKDPQLIPLAIITGALVGAFTYWSYYKSKDHIKEPPLRSLAFTNLPTGPKGPVGKDNRESSYAASPIRHEDGFLAKTFKSQGAGDIMQHNDKMDKEVQAIRAEKEA